ncbi:MAG: hypothetical protein K0A94_11020 [Desulfuromonadales bacterium]|nr:hypothetical protein [Desulfuromonadales bacterium]
MRIEEVVNDAEKRSVELKKQAAKRADLTAKKAAANLKIRNAQQKLQKLNTI